MMLPWILGYSINGRSDWARTSDLGIPNATLSQLSYTPMITTDNFTKRAQSVGLAPYPECLQGHDPCS